MVLLAALLAMVDLRISYSEITPTKITCKRPIFLLDTDQHCMTDALICRLATEARRSCTLITNERNNVPPLMCPVRVESTPLTQPSTSLLYPLAQLHTCVRYAKETLCDGHRAMRSGRPVAEWRIFHTGNYFKAN